MPVKRGLGICALLIAAVAGCLTAPPLIFGLSLISASVDGGLDWIVSPGLQPIAGFSLYFGPLIGILALVLAFVSAGLAIASLARATRQVAAVAALILDGGIVVLFVVVAVASVVATTASTVLL
ncbi:hypothetical protein [Herbiconiux liukaitaii]|uniref:hypothetical protein n=1 Tax=Herbiconiux liukaitaii TaxID=3342799 RepID=UPI0035B9D3B9